MRVVSSILSLIDGTFLRLAVAHHSGLQPPRDPHRPGDAGGGGEPHAVSPGAGCAPTAGTRLLPRHRRPRADGSGRRVDGAGAALFPAPGGVDPALLPLRRLVAGALLRPHIPVA